MALAASLSLLHACGIKAPPRPPRSQAPAEAPAPAEKPAPTEKPAPAEKPAPTEKPAPIEKPAVQASAQPSPDAS